MRRSVLLTIAMVCPHFEKVVSASRNEATGKLVDCSDKARCVRSEMGEGGVTVEVRPAECPVFPCRV